MASMKKKDFLHKVCAVDFDGTLCELEYPNIGAPKMDVINYIKRLSAEGWYIVLWTNREGEFLDAALEWSKQYDIPYDAVNENIPERVEYYGNDSRKIGANLYIDDLAIHPDEVSEFIKGYLFTI